MTPKELPVDVHVSYEDSKAANRYEGRHTININGEPHILNVAFNDDPDFYHWFYYFGDDSDTHDGNSSHFSAGAFFAGCYNFE